jgi:hypothetical protein
MPAFLPSFLPASFLFCLLDAYLDIPLRCYDRESASSIAPIFFFALRFAIYLAMPVVTCHLFSRSISTLILSEQYVRRIWPVVFSFFFITCYIRTLGYRKQC